MPRLDLPPEIVDCPDRRPGRAALELAERTLLSGPRDGLVTVLLPRRQYGPLLGRLLHARTADEIAAAVSQVRGVAATIVPFDASARPRPVRREPEPSASARPHREPASSIGPTPPDRVTIAEAPPRGWAVLQGLVRVEGRVGERHGYLAMANPSYELLPSDEAEPQPPPRSRRG